MVRPVPPADLDQRLIEFYPLRGQVLRENGFARVRFAVDERGVVATSEVLKATHVAYARACRSMLEASTWTPARDAYGNATPYTGTFDCAFENADPVAWRTTLEADMTPPVRPDYGPDWFVRYGLGDVPVNTFAELRIEVDSEGQVSVNGMLPGGHERMAAVCSRMLEEGPRWQPATDKAGRPIRYEGTFSCRVNNDAQHKLITLADVGAAGPLPLEVIASTMTEHLTAFTHCFESAFSMSKPIHGKHWMAFEILPSGALGKLDWVDRPFEDELLETCVFSALRALRFPAAEAATLADVQLELGGISKLQHHL